MKRAWTALVAAGSLGAIALAGLAAANAKSIRRPRGAPLSARMTGQISVLVPARDEERHLAQTLASISAQEHVLDIEVIVLDDGSTDATAAIAEAAAARDPRIRVLRGADEPPPAGWLGKTWACMRLGQAAAGDVLVFVDADVRLSPEALSAISHGMGEGEFDLLSPYPRQVAVSWMERLIQPLLVWSWMSTIPLAAAERSLRPSLSAANGQLLAITATAYRGIGGHASVRAEVIEDVALMRAVKRSGGYCAIVDGSALAECRMYDSADALVDGYAKSLWRAFGGPAGSLAVNAGLALMYLVPPLAAVIGPGSRARALGVAGTAAAIAGRAVTAKSSGGRIWPDAAAHPASIAGFIALNVISWRRHLAGTNSWKGRPVVAGGTPS